MREAEHLKRIIAEEARRRMLAGVTEDGAGGRGRQTNPPATLREGLRHARETVAQVAEAVGMKPRTFVKVEHVYHTAEGEEDAPEPVREVARQQLAALDAGETTPHAAELAQGASR